MELTSHLPVNSKLIRYHGWFWCNASCCVWLAVAAKSSQLKMLGRAAMGPAIFNINEPLILVFQLYTTQFLPSIHLGTNRECFNRILVNQTWLCRVSIIQTPWPTPIGLGAYIGIGGNIGAVITALVCACSSILVWFPFLKMYDLKLLKKKA